MLEHRDDAHRKLKTFGELSSSVFSNGDLTLGFIVEGNYRCVLVPSIGDGDEMNSSPIGMLRWCCAGVARCCCPANCIVRCTAKHVTGRKITGNQLSRGRPIHRARSCGRRRTYFAMPRFTDRETVQVP
mgnify:CR=1 FL=1